MKFTLMVCYVIGPYASSKPYFLLEIYTTSDGMRTRLCDGRFKTEEEAEAARLARKTTGPTDVLLAGKELLDKARL